MGYHHIPNISGGERITRDGRGQGGANVQLCEQPRRGNLQGMCKAEQHQHRNITQTQLDLTDIPVMCACSRGECLLGQPLLLPVLAEGCPKALQWLVLWA